MPLKPKHWFFKAELITAFLVFISMYEPQMPLQGYLLQSQYIEFMLNIIKTLQIALNKKGEWISKLNASIVSFCKSKRGNPVK